MNSTIPTILSSIFRSVKFLRRPSNKIHLNKTQLKLSQAGRASSSANVDEHRGWLSLWAADVPGKAKIHAWRLIKNGLAVGDELQRRKIKEGVKCVVCNRDESLLHRFWRCPHSARMWDILRDHTKLQLDSPPCQVNGHRDLQGWLLDWIGKLDDKERAIGIMAIYQLWLARNDAREEEKAADPKDIAMRSIYLVEEWLQLKAQAVVNPAQVVERWHPPDEDWHKINADGAFSVETGNGGSGVVIRNHHGGFVAGACHFLTSVSDPERAELVACKRAVVLAKEKGLSRVCLETDCLGVVSKLRCRDRDRSVHGPLVEEIKSLLQGFDAHSIRHVRRSSNEVAHRLAKEGNKNNVCNVCLVSPPDFLVELLASECAVN